MGAPLEPPKESQFCIDLYAKASTRLLDSLAKYTLHRFLLTGQTLGIYCGDKLLYSVYAGDLTIQFMADKLYQLNVQGKKQLVLVAASIGFSKFLEALALASSSPTWALPQKNIFENLLDVANDIVETDLQPPFQPFASKVDVACVQSFLRELMSMYVLAGSCSSIEQFYSHLLTIEAAYCNNTRIANFAHTVHKLHPVKYSEAKAQAKNRPKRPSLQSIVTKCPNCHSEIPIETSFVVHIKNQGRVCPVCSFAITQQAFKIASMIADQPSYAITLYNGVNTVLDLPCMPRDGQMTTFLWEIKQRIIKLAKSNAYGANRVEMEVNKNIRHYLETEMGAFEIDLVRAMIRQLEFVNKMCPNFDYWNNSKVIQASIIRYHLFLSMMRGKKRGSFCFVPTLDILLIWQAHQTLSNDYNNFKKQHFFGRLDYEHTKEGVDLQRGYADTFVLWCEFYSEPYSSFEPSYEAWKKSKCDYSQRELEQKWTACGRVPTKDCRYFGVAESFPIESLGFAIANNYVGSSNQGGNIYLPVIGTPVTDNRVQLRNSHQSHLVANLC